MTAVTAADCSLSRKLLCLAAACAWAGCAVAGPLAPVVSAGSASYNPATLTVTSTSARTQINWPGFHVGAGEVVKFIQPSAQSVVVNQVFDPQSLNNLGAVSSNGSVYFLSDGRVSGTGVNLNLAGAISTSLRLPHMALASERASHPDRPAQLTALAGGSIYVIGEDAQALSSAGGDVLLNPGRTVELAHAAMLNLRVLLTAPDTEAINLSRLVGAGRETGIFAGLFRVPAAARRSTQRDAPPVMSAAADARESAEVQRFYRYALLYAQMQRESQRHAAGLMQVAAAPGGRLLLASAKSRPSLLPRDIEIGAPAARARAADTQTAVVPKSAAPVLAAATLEPQAVALATQSEGQAGLASLLAQAPRVPAAEMVATLEPQPIPAVVATEQEPGRALPAALAEAGPAIAVVATLEPLPLELHAARESGELHALARELAVAPQPIAARPVQVAQLQAEPARHGDHVPQPAPTVIVVALSQHAAAPAPAADAEVKEIRIERRAPRYFTDFRGAMFFM
jgi:filamentous hemagglutinin family protein